jgi:hypothetical protein
LSLSLASLVGNRADAQLVIPTNLGAGADAEVRESAPAANRGTSDELATRILDAGPPNDPSGLQDRNSVMYMKFDIGGVGPQNVPGAVLRLTYRNDNLAAPRVEDGTGSGATTGLVYYGLDPNHPGNDWEETAISYATAPGLTPDGDVGTKDYDTAAGNLILLGTRSFPPVGVQNHLPIGGALDFVSPLLDQLLSDALGAGRDTVTILAGVQHEGDVGISGWVNFNYLFNPKEKTTLNIDAYDPDTTDAVPPIGNLFGTDNTMGAFSPQLRLVPAPGTFSLLALGLVSLPTMAGRYDGRAPRIA